MTRIQIVFTIKAIKHEIKRIEKELQNKNYPKATKEYYKKKIIDSAVAIKELDLIHDEMMKYNRKNVKLTLLPWDEE